MKGKDKQYVLKKTEINYNNFNINLKMKKSFNVHYYNYLIKYYETYNINNISSINTNINKEFKIVQSNNLLQNTIGKLTVTTEWSNYFSYQLLFHPSIIYNTILIDYNQQIYNNDYNTLFRRFNTYFASGNHPYINQTIQHIIIDAIIVTNEYKSSILKQYSAFICHSTKNIYYGYNITPMANNGTLDKIIISGFDKDNMYFENNYKQILSSILNPLAFLKQMKYGFCHNDLKCKNIFVHTNKSKLEYKIADYDKSSIFYNGIRFYPSFSGLKIASGLIDIQFYKNIPYYQLKSLSYIVKFTNIPADQIYIFYTSKPMPMSFDYYILMITILRNIFYKYYVNLSQNNQTIQTIETIHNNITYTWEYINKHFVVVKDILLLFKLNNSIDDIFIKNFIQIYDDNYKNNQLDFNKILSELNSLSNVFVFLNTFYIKLLVDIDEFLDNMHVNKYTDYDNIIIKSKETIISKFKLDPIQTIVTNGAHHNDIIKCIYKNGKLIHNGTISTLGKKYCFTDTNNNWDHVGH